MISLISIIYSSFSFGEVASSILFRRASISFKGLLHLRELQGGRNDPDLFPVGDGGRARIGCIGGQIIHDSGLGATITLSPMVICPVNPACPPRVTLLPIFVEPEIPTCATMIESSPMTTL